MVSSGDLFSLVTVVRVKKLWGHAFEPAFMNTGRSTHYDTSSRYFLASSNSEYSTATSRASELLVASC